MLAGLYERFSSDLHGTCRGCEQNKIWHKGSLGDEDDARTSNTYSAETAHDTTLDNENASQHAMSVLVTLLCNQSEAFASDLGDNRSCYLLELEFV